MGEVVRFPKHKWAHCGSDCNGCCLCHGGLALCTVCGGGEGSLPDHCPGGPMTNEQSDAVYAGRLNFRNGAWRNESSVVMTPVSV